MAHVTTVHGHTEDHRRMVEHRRGRPVGSQTRFGAWRATLCKANRPAVATLRVMNASLVRRLQHRRIPLLPDVARRAGTRSVRASDRQARQPRHDAGRATAGVSATTVRRHDLTDVQWAVLEPRDVPEVYPPWQTPYRWFHRWQRDGLSLRLPGDQDPRALANHEPRLTADTVGSPLRRKAHGGFGERSGETGRGDIAIQRNPAFRVALAQDLQPTTADVDMSDAQREDLTRAKPAIQHQPGDRPVPDLCPPAPIGHVLGGFRRRRIPRRRE
jgi:hypothetical protein